LTTVEPMKQKILVVEDNPDSREILSLILQKMGHVVIEAHDSKEAIASATAEYPDLILMDLGLPDMDGVKTTAALKKNPATARIPVVAVSAWFKELWEQKAIDAGIAEFLTKPTSPATLTEVIGRFTRAGSYSLAGRLVDERKSYG
jgi:two-component system cell cycle response regulator DivK